ncbi:MAG: hypothetical protein QW728_02500 [Thermoplasmata archaeon]
MAIRFRRNMNFVVDINGSMIMVRTELLRSFCMVNESLLMEENSGGRSSYGYEYSTAIAFNSWGVHKVGLNENTKFASDERKVIKKH